MHELINQLGLDWKSLVSQAVNFAILLVVLRTFIYKPVIGILKKRKEKIEEGLEKARVAEERLKEIATIAKGKIKEAEREGLFIVKQFEERGKNAEAEILKRAKNKEQEILERALLTAKNREEEARRFFEKEAAALVKAAVAKTAAVNPEQIDEALVKQALKQAKKQ